jgi:hypothetical protein
VRDFLGEPTIPIAANNGQGNFLNVLKINDSNITDVELNADDHNEADTLKNVFPNSSEEVIISPLYYILMARSPHGNRWGKYVIIHVCICGPGVFLRIKMIILPSGRQLQRYKNNTPQMPGIHFDML